VCIRTDDPLADFNRHEAEQQEQMDKLPICAECGYRITAEKCYEINGKYICPECLENNHEHYTEDII